MSLRQLGRAAAMGVAILWSATAIAQSSCMLLGQSATLSVTGASGGDATATVQAGIVEFEPAPGNALLSVDVAGATVRIFNNTPATSVSFPVPTTYTLTLGGPAPLSITGVDITISGVTGLAPGAVNFTPGAVTLTATGTTWPGTAGVTITLQTSCFDIDGNGSTDPLTDGLLILRHLFGLSGPALVNGAIAPDASRATADLVAGYLAHIAARLDVDGDGHADALTDGLLLIRYFFGLRGDALIAGATAPLGTRTSAGDVESYIDALLNSPVNQGPQVGAGSSQTIELPAAAGLAGNVVDDGLPNPPGAVTATWTKQSGPGTVVFGDLHAPVTAATFGAAGTYVLRLTADDGAAAAQDEVTITVNPPQGPPPDPSTVAPPIDPTVVTSVFDATAFLYTGANPTQTGVAPGTIQLVRAAVLRGRVLDRDGAAIPGVRLAVHGHSEFGQTLSRADGRFDLAVNGGGTLTLNYTKTGLLPVQRQSTVPWQDFVAIDDVVMIPVDAQFTTLTSGAGAMQVARGSVQTDDSGSRRGTVLIPAGTTASLVQPDGSLLPVGTLNVRLTEYTVGATGPAAMPGPLPPTSGYTYAIELGVDEAVAKVNGRDVVFSQPVSFYVENFLNFPIGINVPVGFYDRDKAAWVASDNGRVIRILSISSGMADLDTDGDNVADNAAALAALGITDAERAQLATLYVAGQSLWRMQTTHFSTWDCNWPFGPPPDATKPDKKKPKNDKPFKGPCEDDGSIITCQSQVLGESARVNGAPYRLRYSSDRTPGRKAAYAMEIPVSGATVPASLLRIELTIAIAGRQFRQTFPGTPNQQYTFTWDGQDAYGRTVEGNSIATVRVGYVYAGTYQKTTRFGYNGDGVPISGSMSRQEVTIWQESRTPLGVVRGEVGGWSLNVHHRYDPIAKTLYKGDGRRQDDQDALGAFISTVAGTGACCYEGDGGQATLAKLNNPAGIAFAPDGTWYFVDFSNIVVRRVGADGVITTVAGNNSQGYSGDGGPATAAGLVYPTGLAVGADGSLYIGDFGRVRRVAPDGIISTVAGNGTHVNSGDGGPATSAGFASSFGANLALAPDGTLYITATNALRRVTPDGIISTVAVNANSSDSGIAIGPDGSLYITHLHLIRRIDPAGVMTIIAGNGSPGYTGDGGLATAAQVRYAAGIAVGADGAVYFTSAFNSTAITRVRRIGPDGIITTIAGSGTFGAYGGDGGLATQGQMNSVVAIAIAADGSLLVSDALNRRVRRIGSQLPGLGANDLALASADGSEVYGFSGNGRHLRTIAALTGVVKHLFAYDAQGRLATVTDRNGNVTTIARDGSGNPVSITAPGGQITSLATVNGYLTAVTNPANETTQFTYNADGLLLTKTDPNGGFHQFTYDARGRLTKDEGPAGAIKTLARVDDSEGYTVTMTTAVGRVFTFQVQELPSGVVRRLNSDESGAVTESLANPDGTETINLPTGESIVVTAGPDPRFGMQAPRLTKLVRTLPGGQVHTTTSQRTVTLSNPADPFSLLTQTDTVTVNGQSYVRSYNAGTRTMTATSAEGRQIVSVLDVKGRLTSNVLGTGMSAYQFAYDAGGRVTEVRQGPQFWTLGYDAANRLVSRTDAAGRTVAYVHDPADRVIQQTLPSGAVYQYAYDANGNRTQVTLPSGAVHGLGYTAADRDASYTPPGNPNYSRTFDADGRLTRTTLPGGRFADQSYDSAGRPLLISFPEAVTGFAYPAADFTGRPSQITHAPTAGTAQNMTFTWNGSLVAGMTATGAAPAATTYTYNNDLRPTAMQMTSGADTVQAALTWDKDGVGTGFGPFTFTRAGPGGAPSKIADAAANVTYTYDTLARIATRSHQAGGLATYGMQLTYDLAGRISAKTETVGGVAHVLAYTYDLDGQLTEVRRDGTVTEAYAYDVNGNRTSRTIGAGPAEPATYDAQDRLILRGATAYQFDVDGFLTQRGADTFQYSTRGRLLQATVGGQPITYAYDGLDRRVARTDAGGTYRYLYADPASHLITAVRDPAGQLTTLYYDAAGLLVALERGGVRYYVATDQTGSPRVVSDGAGTVVKVLEFDTLGNPVGDSNPGFDLPLGYAGGLPDTATGLVHFGYREYEPASGRWTSRDPALFGAGQGNLYVYVGNNPVNNRDPSGLICVSVTMYAFYGGGVQTCIGLDGASVCGEIGLGAGGGIGVDLGTLNVGPLGGGPGVDTNVKPGLFSGKLDGSGVSEGAEVALECGPVEAGGGAVLTMEGCLTVSGKGGLEFFDEQKHGKGGSHLREFFEGKCKLEGKWYAKACMAQKL